jgi:AAA domain
LKNLTIRIASHDRADMLIEQLKALGDAAPGSGRFLFFSGPAGCGKTYYARALARRTGMPLLTLRMTSTVRGTLSALAEEILGFYPLEKTVDSLFVRVRDELISRPDIGMILLDEGDSLDQAPRFVLLNTFRQLSDSTGVAICIFSTDSLMQRLALPTRYLEQATSRIFGSVAFKRPGIADARQLAELIEIRLERDLIGFALAAARGSLRQLVNIFRGIETGAKAGGVDTPIDLARAVALGLISAPEPNQKTGPATSQETTQTPVTGGVRAA